MNIYIYLIYIVLISLYFQKGKSALVEQETFTASLYKAMQSYSISFFSFYYDFSNPLLPSTTYMTRLAKNFILILGGIIKNFL